MNENNRYSKSLYKNWKKIIWHEKKKGNLRYAIAKVKKKGEFECPRNESLVFKRGYPNHVWTQGVMDTKNHNNKG